MHRRNKSWGQNFLISDRIAKRIIRIAKIDKDDYVLEIGPGRGALTRDIAIAGNSVVAVEKDHYLANYLRTKLSPLYQNLKIIDGDILKVNIPDLFPSIDRIKVVSNLPYSIATSFISMMIEYRSIIDSSVLMVQEEVGLRLTAKPSCKDYSPISILVQNYFDVHNKFTVHPAFFKPQPKVSGMVLLLERRENPIYKTTDLNNFRHVLHAAFMHRRKKMINSLAISLNIEKSEIEGALTKVGLKENVRAEDVSILEYGKFFDNLEKLVYKE